mmetsp:Transcript_41273/g.104057  ORF Transcript_41273/g.104057 Transcript_41273/m.104057 type:complete len:173 (-) Transcript_41273:48-566(-)
MDTLVRLPDGDAVDQDKYQDRAPADEVPLLVVMSFGYRYGAAHNTWKTVNLRALPNPASNRSLSKQVTGLNRRLAENLFCVPEAELAYTRARASFQSLVDEATDAELACVPGPLAFGCNLGRHRSVAFAERLARDGLGPRVRLTVLHRDIDREPASKKEHKGKKNRQQRRLP